MQSGCKPAVIYYEAEGYTTSGSKLMGRQAAGEGFLRAAAQSNVQRLVCYTSNSQAGQHFSSTLSQYGFHKKADWITQETPQALADEGCLYLPGPNIAEFAWHRAPLGSRAYSLCGITHTTASHLAMTAITTMLTAPLYNWDALICTSSAVRDSVRVLLENQADYLRQRVGATHFELPQLPMIPLGVHCEDYIFSDVERLEARQQLGIAPDEVVALFVGRLSFHAKAHPLQMYTALERASKGYNVRLIQCGWFANDHIEKAFKEGAETLCPSIKTDFIDGRNSQHRRYAWAAANIFLSLSDNIQETFGLTPLEAMAAGLPCIVSDWNGYKDTVRDDIDGFRIPTLMPAAPLGQELAYRYQTGQDSYDRYCGYTSQLTAIDPIALEVACKRLIQDTALRQRMGQAAQEHARTTFDWSVIYRHYQALWEELHENRRSAPNLHSTPIKLTSPDRLDPFAVFASYPSSLLSQHHLVTLLPSSTLDTLAHRQRLTINIFSEHLHPTPEECGTLLKLLSTHTPQKIQDILSAFPAAQHPRLLRGMVWLAKIEILRITAP